MDGLAKIFVALVVGFVASGGFVLFALAQQGATRDFFLAVSVVLVGLCIFGMFAVGIRMSWNKIMN